MATLLASAAATLLLGCSVFQEPVPLPSDQAQAKLTVFTQELERIRAQMRETPAMGALGELEGLLLHELPTTQGAKLRAAPPGMSPTAAQPHSPTPYLQALRWLRASIDTIAWMPPGQPNTLIWMLARHNPALGMGTDASLPAPSPLAGRFDFTDSQGNPPQGHYTWAPAQGQWAAGSPDPGADAQSLGLHFPTPAPDGPHTMSLTLSNLTHVPAGASGYIRSFTLVMRNGQGDSLSIHYQGTFDRGFPLGVQLSIYNQGWQVSRRLDLERAAERIIVRERFAIHEHGQERAASVLHTAFVGNPAVNPYAYPEAHHGYTIESVDGHYRSQAVKLEFRAQLGAFNALRAHPAITPTELAAAANAHLSVRAQAYPVGHGLAQLRWAASGADGLAMTPQLVFNDQTLAPTPGLIPAHLHLHLAPSF